MHFGSESWTALYGSFSAVCWVDVSTHHCTLCGQVCSRFRIKGKRQLQHEDMLILPSGYEVPFLKSAFVRKAQWPARVKDRMLAYCASIEDGTSILWIKRTRSVKARFSSLPGLLGAVLGPCADVKSAEQ